MRAHAFYKGPLRNIEAELSSSGGAPLEITVSLEGDFARLREALASYPESGPTLSALGKVRAAVAGLLQRIERLEAERDVVEGGYVDLDRQAQVLREDLAQAQAYARSMDEQAARAKEEAKREHDRAEAAGAALAELHVQHAALHSRLERERAESARESARAAFAAYHGRDPEPKELEDLLDNEHAQALRESP